MGMTLAEAAYEAYGEAVGWKNFRGDAMPEWHELPEVIQDAWSEAAAASVKHWTETEFKAACNSKERIDQFAGAMIKVGVEDQRPTEEILPIAISGFVLSVVGEL